MSKKEDSLRNKAKSSLDPKGWEALLEGVPRADDEKSGGAPSKETPEPSPPAQKHVLKVTDESGDVSEKVTFEERSGAARPEAPAAPPKAQPPSPQAGSSETPSAPSGPPESGPSDKPAEQPTEKETRLSRAADWILQQPQIQRAIHYYKGLNPREQRIIVIGSLFLFIVFAYAYVLDPLFEKSALVNRKIDKKREELSEMIRLSSSVVQDRGGMDQIKKVIEQRDQGFSVFAYLEQLATKAEMKDKIVYIKPQRETPVGPFRESLAEIKLERASLEDLTRFLYQIESSEDLLYIKNVKIKTGRSKNIEGFEVTLSVGTLLQGR